MTVGWESRLMSYYVYILASRRDGAIYVGITNDLVRRVYEHRIKAVPGFTSKYNITQLVWFEIYDDPISAITREKELKKWKRAWKVQLIEAQNAQWQDLYESICK
jgi:putative endonuclease